MARLEIAAEVVLTNDRLFIAESVEVVGGLVTATGRYARRRVPTGPVVRRTWGPGEVREVRWSHDEVNR